MSGIGTAASRRRYQRPAQRRLISLEVEARETLSPHFALLTLRGDGVQYVEQAGYDQWGRFFLPGPGQDSIELPSSTRWMIQLGRIPSAVRPRVRSYTIRRFHPGGRAFDVEVATHEPVPGQKPAPGSEWAISARPGDLVGFLDEGRQYNPDPDARWQLLVADESALPAALAILEAAPDLPAVAFLEVPTDEDVRSDFEAPEGSTVHWLPRNDHSLRPGTLALNAVKEAALLKGPFYAWTAGESALATGARRYLVNERNIPKSRIDFTGYWRYGKASLG